MLQCIESGLIQRPQDVRRYSRESPPPPPPPTPTPNPTPWVSRFNGTWNSGMDGGNSGIVGGPVGGEMCCLGALSVDFDRIFNLLEG